MTRLSSSAFRRFVRKIIGYFGVGGVAACVDATGFYIAKYHLGFHYMPALVIGFIPGVLTNFLLCNFLLFKKFKRTLLGAWLRHLISSLFSLCVNASVMFILVQLLHFHYYLLARLIAIGIGFMVSFTLIRYFAFQDNKHCHEV